MSEGLAERMARAGVILDAAPVPTEGRKLLRELPMVPFERTALEWATSPRERELPWYEEQHKLHGFVFATPAFYVMGRPVRKYAPIEQILDVTHVFDFDTCDTWFIFLLTGSLKQALPYLPWELPWMCWQRDEDQTERLRFCETARLKRMCGME